MKYAKHAVKIAFAIVAALAILYAFGVLTSAMFFLGWMAVGFVCNYAYLVSINPPSEAPSYVALISVLSLLGSFFGFMGFMLLALRGVTPGRANLR